MAKSVRNVADLPSWFRLDNYAESNLLDAGGWYEQLSVRNWFLRFLDWRDEDDRELNCFEREALAFLRATPIVDVTADEKMRVYFYDGAMHEIRTNKPNYSLGVRPSTVRDLYLVERNIESKKREYARNFFAQIFDKEKDWLNEGGGLKYKCVDWIDEPVDAISNPNGARFNLCVDMSLPDKVLVDQFKKFLQSQRVSSIRQVGEVGRNRRANFDDWIAYGILPFLDLTIWGRETKTKIPNRVMADAIFPLGEGGEEVVRKTTSKIAEELMTRGSLQYLAAIACQ